MRQNTSYYTGVKGEEVASAYLESIGFLILGRRWKSKFGEIDVIARNSSTLLFVEVKTRGYLKPEIELISERQKKRNSKAALDFLSSYQLDASLSARFDLILVSNNQILNHVENAWYIYC